MRALCIRASCSVASPLAAPRVVRGEVAERNSAKAGLRSMLVERLTSFCLLPDAGLRASGWRLSRQNVSRSHPSTPRSSWGICTAHGTSRRKDLPPTPASSGCWGLSICQGRHVAKRPASCERHVARGGAPPGAVYRYGRVGIVEDVIQRRADGDYDDGFSEEERGSYEQDDDDEEEEEEFSREDWGRYGTEDESAREAPAPGERFEGGFRAAAAAFPDGVRPAASAAGVWWEERPFRQPEARRSGDRRAQRDGRRNEEDGDAAWLWGERGLLLLLRAFLSSFRRASREVKSAMGAALPPSVPRGLVLTAVGGMFALAALWLAQVLLQVAFTVGAAALVVVLIVRGFWVAGALIRADAASPLDEDDGASRQWVGSWPGPAPQAYERQRRRGKDPRSRTRRPNLQGLQAIFSGRKDEVEANVPSMQEYSSERSRGSAGYGRTRRRGYEPSDRFEPEEWRWNSSAA